MRILLPLLIVSSSLYGQTINLTNGKDTLDIYITSVEDFSEGPNDISNPKTEVATFICDQENEQATFKIEFTSEGPRIGDDMIGLSMSLSPAPSEGPTYMNDYTREAEITVAKNTPVLSYIHTLLYHSDAYNGATTTTITLYPTSNTEAKKTIRVFYQLDNLELNLKPYNNNDLMQEIDLATDTEENCFERGVDLVEVTNYAQLNQTLRIDFEHRHVSSKSEQFKFLLRYRLNEEEIQTIAMENGDSSIYMQMGSMDTLDFCVDAVGGKDDLLRGWFEFIDSLYSVNSVRLNVDVFHDIVDGTSEKPSEKYDAVYVPSSEILQVNSPTASLLQIVDLQGKVITEKQVSGQNNFSLRDLPKSVYFIQITPASGEQYSWKILK